MILWDINFLLSYISFKCMLTPYISIYEVKDTHKNQKVRFTFLIPTQVQAHRL